MRSSAVCEAATSWGRESGVGRTRVKHVPGMGERETVWSPVKGSRGRNLPGVERG
jgi:hypothetical protein